MLQVMKGRLAKDGQIRKVQTSKGKMEVCNNAIYVKPKIDSDDKEEIIIPITAWGDRAKELANCKRGSLIEFIGNLKSETYKPKDTDVEITRVAYDVQAIDMKGDLDLLKKSNDTLNDMVKSINGVPKEQEKGPEME